MLEINNLVCGYDERIIIKDINLKVEKGELVGIIGPNGCGKTTLFRAITKILKLKEGKIFFNGKDIEGINYAQLARELAVVSQDIPLEGMNAEDYVLLGRLPYRKRFQFMESHADLEIAERAMEIVDVTQFRKRYINELSGGERQRVFISRAIAQEPKLLLLDEPTTHLDIGHQIEILELLKSMKGLTIIIILHDLNLASCYCDRLVLMSEGRIYKEGGADTVLTYQNIEAVYKTVVLVEKSRITGKPHIFVVPREG